MRQFLSVFSILLAFFVFGLVVSSYTSGPRLVGYDCDNSSGPLYANEEDHFPLCERIEQVTVGYDYA